MVARPMKSVIRLSNQVMKLFLFLLQLNGCSLSPGANLRRITSSPLICFVSVSVSGRSISTSLSGPSSLSELSPSFPRSSSKNFPPAVRPLVGCFLSTFSLCSSAMELFSSLSWALLLRGVWDDTD